MNRVALLVALTVTFAAFAVYAAPDEAKLGRQLGYPVGTGATWYYDEAVRVGSFTHQSEIKRIYDGRPNTLQASSKPMQLPNATQEPPICWNAKQARDLTLDDYLARQRIMGLIIVKDGVVQLERYQ